jgi:hypothetical protein
VPTGRIECYGACTYIVTAKCHLDHPTTWFPLVAVPVTASQISGHHAEPLSFAEWVNGPNFLALPLRLHLLNQILLV